MCTLNLQPSHAAVDPNMRLLALRAWDWDRSARHDDVKPILQNLDWDLSDCNCVVQEAYFSPSNSMLTQHEGQAGYPVQVVKVEPDGTFQLDQDLLASLLLSDAVRDRKVVVVSVAGAFRKGKSFLLNFFIRYLDHQDDPNWFGSNEDTLKGFSWRGGCERETTGILFWSRPFPVKLPSGEEVVLLLMDTQGTFDSSSTVKQCATVFALSTMLSSVQIYNLSSNIQEDNLQHLQLFTEYGRLALNENSRKPFQRLEFLIRDWSFPYDHQYGDGSGFLAKRLAVNAQQHPELQRVREHISSCFDKIGCFLLPHPGFKVACNPSFNGNLNDIDPDFKVHLHEFVLNILAPHHLRVKLINGCPVTGRGLFEYFKCYMEIYQGDTLPEPKSLLDATAEANNLAALASAKDLYKTEMDKLCGPECAFVQTAQLEVIHVMATEKSMELFRSTPKMGGESLSSGYLSKLEVAINDLHIDYLKQNEAKNIFNVFRTPVVLLLLIAVLYVLGAVFNAIGFTTLTSLANTALCLALVTLGVWVYFRVSGAHNEIAGVIDNVAEFLWREIVQPATTAAITNGLEMPSTASQLKLKRS